MNLKRVEVKYVRDGIKSQYKKQDTCFISGETESLQLHHFHTVSLLWDKWKKEKGIVIADVEEILDIREDFYSDHWYELIEDTVTLTDFWHNQKLHKIYGMKPPLHTAAKQRRWVERMRNKFHV